MVTACKLNKATVKKRKKYFEIRNALETTFKQHQQTIIGINVFDKRNENVDI